MLSHTIWHVSKISKYGRCPNSFFQFENISFPKVYFIFDSEPILTLVTLKETCCRNYEQLATALRNDFEEAEIEQIHKALCTMPTLDVQFSLIGQYNEDVNACRSIQIPATKDDWLQIHREQEYTLKTNFHRYVNKMRRTNETLIPKAHCPKFTKAKDEGWFLVLGAPHDGELIAMKRCSYRNTRSTHQITFKAPHKIGRFIYTVYIMSDTYIGFDQQYDIHLEVIDGVDIDQNDIFNEFDHIYKEKI